MRAHVAYIRPKDANAAFGVRDRTTEKAPEGYDGQVDKQTFRAI